MVSEKALFRRMAERKSIEWGSFTLSSGLRTCCKAHFGRDDVGEAPDYLVMLGEKTLDILEDADAFEMGKQICLIGVSTAGVPLAQAASAIHYGRTGSDNVVFRMIRPFVGRASDSETRLWTHGEPNPGQHYWIIENVCTTASAIWGVHSRLLEQGYPAEQISILTMVDRELNGMERLREKGIPQSRIAVGWTITELIGRMQTFGFMPDLPKNAVALIQQEIDEFHTNRPF